MIIKPRKMPIQIKKLEALLRRLPQEHPKRVPISNSLAKQLAGYKGEKELDYPLSFLPEEEYMIFHDLRLFDGSHYFQLDSLLVSKHFLLILEVKNIQGTLRFDPDFNQLIRIHDGKEEGFSDPLLQVERQTNQLRKWLNNQNCPRIPIESLIVVSTPRTIIEVTSNKQQINNKVIHSAKLPFKIRSIKEIYPRRILNNKQLHQLTTLIVENHIPLDINIFEQTNIYETEIIKGIQCSQCLSFSMERKIAKWICSTCGNTSKTAHINAINEYVLLIGNEITNSKLKDFLKLTSSSVVNKILLSLNLKSSGSTKGKIYYLKINDN